MSDTSLTLICDECAREATFTGSWKLCMAQARQLGWMIVKEDDWKHYCPTCALDPFKSVDEIIKQTKEK